MHMSELTYGGISIVDVKASFNNVSLTLYILVIMMKHLLKHLY